MRFAVVLLILALGLPGAACGGDAAREADRPYTAGLARVERVEVEVSRRAPVDAWAVVSGQLPDACTELQSPDVRRNGSVFDVVLETRRPFGAMCAQMLVPFERRIRLGVDTEVSGAYVVNVNGVSQSFAVNVIGGRTAY
jgi:inhibitor of cysteine peptidase